MRGKGCLGQGRSPCAATLRNFPPIVLWAVIYVEELDRAAEGRVAPEKNCVAGHKQECCGQHQHTHRIQQYGHNGGVSDDPVVFTVTINGHVGAEEASFAPRRLGGAGGGGDGGGGAGGGCDGSGQISATSRELVWMASLQATGRHGHCSHGDVACSAFSMPRRPNENPGKRPIPRADEPYGHDEPTAI